MRGGETLKMVKASPRTGKEKRKAGAPSQVSSEGARLLVFLGGARVQP